MLIIQRTVRIQYVRYAMRSALNVLVLISTSAQNVPVAIIWIPWRKFVQKRAKSMIMDTKCMITMRINPWIYAVNPAKLMTLVLSALISAKLVLVVRVIRAFLVKMGTETNRKRKTREPRAYVGQNLLKKT